jgi:hypothetical protein
VAVDYQREVLPLMLLLRGLAVVLLRYPQFEHFIGPVSISVWYPKFYKSLMVHYVSSKHPVGPSWEGKVKPKMPYHPDFLKVDSEALLRNNMESVEGFDKFMFRLSNGSYRMPTLFKTYLKLNAKFLAFNVDPEFNNVVDGLLFLTFKDFPESEILALFRDSTPEELEAVRKRFWGS